MTTTLTPNIPLLRKVLEQIDAHPELHNQDGYDLPIYDEQDNVCGTTHCIAGWAIVLSDGYRYDPREEQFLDAGGAVVDAEWTARHLLGLTDEQAWTYDGALRRGLFSPGSSRGRIQEIAEGLAEIAGEVL